MNRQSRRSFGRRAARTLAAAACVCVLAAAPSGCDRLEPGAVLEPYLPRTAHQAYGHSLAQARLAGTAMGREWIEAAERALAQPEHVELPFTATGAFDRARPAALGYAFSARPGRRVVLDVQVESAPRVELFVDLFERSHAGRTHVASAAPLPLARAQALAGAAEHRSRRIEVRAVEAADYAVRIQPELLTGGSYRIEIREMPLLDFPVSGLDTRAIQSGFGAERDGGARAHRGVDIFASRGTEALAAMDGWVARVDTTPRGGNVVWLQPLFGNMRLYYAHLDTQRVERGQFVEAGEVIGTVGNTGNAITTPPHLHFGVYLRQRGRRGGARDPYPFLE